MVLVSHKGSNTGTSLVLQSLPLDSYPSVEVVSRREYNLLAKTEYFYICIVLKVGEYEIS